MLIALRLECIDAQVSYLLSFQEALIAWPVKIQRGLCKPAIYYLSD